MSSTLLSSTGCNTCQTTPVNVEVPGPAGSNAFSITTDDFVMPAEGVTVNVEVADSTWAVIGQIVFIEGAGHFEVTAVPDGTHITIENIENSFTGAYDSNAAATTVISSGAGVTPAGLQGPVGGDDANLMVFGREYLSAFHNDIRLGNAPHIRFSGDSTTVGSAAPVNADSPGGQGYIWLDTYTILLNKLEQFTYDYNVDGAGKTINWWRTNALGLQADLATNPNLLIIRWGLNPYSSTGNPPVDFNTELRAALTTIRAAKTVSQMSIVLMTPNAADNSGVTPHRDMDYLLAINAYARQAARDFQCVFIDTTRIFPDAFSDDDWMVRLGDEVPPTTPVDEHVAPYSVFTETIASLIVDTIIPESIREKWGVGLHTRQSNPSSSILTPAAADLPNAFHFGINHARAANGEGWPVGGSNGGGVLTFRQADSVGLQMQYDYATTPPRVAGRTMKAGNTFGAWMEMSCVNDTRTNAGARAVTDLPSAYNDGMHMYSVTNADGWPNVVASGTLMVRKFANGFVTQTLLTDSGTTYIRSSQNSTTWLPWCFVMDRYSGISIAFSQGAGGTPTVTSVTGDAVCGLITFTTGGTAPTVDKICRVNLVTSYPQTIVPVITPANEAAALKPVYAVGASASLFDIYATTGNALANTTTYQYYYHLNSRL